MPIVIARVRPRASGNLTRVDASNALFVFLVAAMPAAEEGEPEAAERLPAKRLPPSAGRYAPMAVQTGS